MEKHLIQLKMVQFIIQKIFKSYYLYVKNFPKYSKNCPNAKIILPFNEAHSGQRV